jgi:hypothetical protein
MSEKTKLTPQERKELTADLREKHEPIFKALGIPEAKYIPKMAYRPRGLNALHMGFFESELIHAEDIYTEMVGIMMDSEDPSRTLYKYRGNPHFKQELPSSDEEHTSSTRYYVPMDELEVVTMPAKKKRGPYKKKVKPNRPIRTVILDPSDDLPMASMTIRDYIAIHTGRPVSAKDWINKIMEESN